MCVHYREGGWDQRGGDNRGAPYVAQHLNGPLLTYPPSLIVHRVLEDGDLALGINLLQK